MNKWECEYPECTATAVGVGGAVGLRAIGWYFKRGDGVSLKGPDIYCPFHRPDPIPCEGKYSTDNHGNDCSECAGERQATGIQAFINDLTTQNA